MVQPKKGLGQVPKNQINERVPLMRAKNREERGRGCSPLTVELRVALVGPIGAAVFHLNGATSKGPFKAVLLKKVRLVECIVQIVAIIGFDTAENEPPTSLLYH